MLKQLSKNNLQIALEVKEILSANFGEIIKEIICYGSKVYSEKQDSDFDLLVITSEKITWQTESEMFSHVFSYGIGNDIQFDVKYFSYHEVYSKYDQMPFIKNVLSYGVHV